MNPLTLLVSHDAGLLRHWESAGLPAPLQRGAADLATWTAPAGLAALQPQAVVWLDTSLPALPVWESAPMRQWTARSRVIAASSSPSRDEGLRALDAGCLGYCHAFADVDTLRQVHTVVASGGLWTGPELLQHLLGALHQRLPPPARPDWQKRLTVREVEVARLAARGLPNAGIARECAITERTVKAHLAAVFEKLGVADRLQLALKVHGLDT